jgi:hypothetical protein
VSEELTARVAVLEAHATASRDRDNQIADEVKDAAKALWAAVDELRKRPTVSPIVATLISVLCLLLGFASNAALR